VPRDTFQTGPRDARNRRLLVCQRADDTANSPVQRFSLPRPAS